MSTPAHDWVNYADGLPGYLARLCGVVIENRPAETVMLQHDGPRTLHYVDPPYVQATRNRGNPYCKKGAYRHEATDDDHRNLAETLNGLTGMVVLSGYPSDLYEEIYRRWSRVERPSQADGARKRKEILWLNESAANRLPAMLPLTMQPRAEGDIEETAPTAG